MTRVGVLGSSGRMGTLVCHLIQGEYAKRATLAASVDKGGSLDSLLATDVVIDFSSPGAMLELAQKAQAAPGKVPAFVVGSTGWKIDDRRVLEELAKKTKVLVSSNFSTGVTALIEILKYATPLLEKLGYSPVVVETHHKHKKDAPSGTAISLQRAISPAGPGNVQTHSVRAGEIIGDHEVTFYGHGDHIVLGHFAQDRSIFARGAIDVGLWLEGSQSASQGLLGMDAYFKTILPSKE